MRLATAPKSTFQDSDAACGRVAGALGPTTRSLDLRAARRVEFLAALLAIVGANGACGQGRPPVAGLDSIVLERTPCFGTCPAYRLSVARTGVVVFASRNHGDSARVARDSISPGAVAWLRAEAERQGVLRLPAVIADDHSLCPDRATDHPTFAVSFFSRDRTYRITDYHGCFASNDHSIVSALDGLRHFEAEIDSVTGSSRWVRPNRFR